MIALYLYMDLTWQQMYNGFCCKNKSTRCTSRCFVLHYYWKTNGWLHTVFVLINSF